MSDRPKVTQTEVLAQEPGRLALKLWRSSGRMRVLFVLFALTLLGAMAAVYGRIVLKGEGASLGVLVAIAAITAIPTLGMLYFALSNAIVHVTDGQLTVARFPIPRSTRLAHDAIARLRVKQKRHRGEQLREYVTYRLEIEPKGGGVIPVMTFGSKKEAGWVKAQIEQALAGG